MKKYLLLFCALSLFITGCSSKFAYNNIDWLMYWYIDDYVELDKTQKKLLDGHVSQWMKWHREDELTEYQAQLEQIKLQISQNNVSAQQWEQHFNNAKQHWVRFRDHISPELVRLAPSLSDEQVNALFAELDKENQKRIEERQDSNVEKRLKKNIKNTQENAREFIGKLSVEQKNIIMNFAEDFQSSFDLWMAYRQRIQSAAHDMLLNERKEAHFKQSFLTLLSQPETYQDEKLAQISTHNNQVYASMLAALSTSLTPKQQRKAMKELQDIIDDITDLQED
ncbi:DUF6279 family lipoprotein [Paraglaciecola sp. 20A4]|uniref:DUF6279 family lipoprotein n=1 Tax=Paraglaciecola sp. 20A4 TaxID=2687288 RepID=UPI001407E97A|nr:DUF6279 family lipoprotein [Paraglaciecola sp. 20A4]